jgi:hypothetical protein
MDPAAIRGAALRAAAQFSDLKEIDMVLTRTCSWKMCIDRRAS